MLDANTRFSASIHNFLTISVLHPQLNIQPTSFHLTPCERCLYARQKMPLRTAKDAKPDCGLASFATQQGIFYKQMARSPCVRTSKTVISLSNSSEIPDKLFGQKITQRMRVAYPIATPVANHRPHVSSCSSIPPEPYTFTQTCTYRFYIEASSKPTE